MQMDAVYLTNEQVPNTADNEQVSNAADHQALFFASLCFSSVWEDWEKSKILQPVDESELKVKEIAQKLLEFFSETASSVHSLFFAFHEHFVSFRVDWIVHNDKDLLQIKSSSVKTEPVHVIVSSPENQLPSKSPLIKKFIIIVVVLILGIAMSLLAWHTSYHSLHIKYDETKTLLENEKEKIQKKDLEIDELKKENENLKKGNENLKKGNENLKKENENLENQLQDSRKNADESLKKENESLNSENKKLNEKVNQIRKYVNQISKDVENTINILKD
jgi:FtsZ-binding cell division protein ZapB